MFIVTFVTIDEWWGEKKVSINRLTDKQDMVYTYSGIVFTHKKEGNSATCYNIGKP